MDILQRESPHISSHVRTVVVCFLTSPTSGILAAKGFSWDASWAVAKLWLAMNEKNWRSIWLCSFRWGDFQIEHHHEETHSNDEHQYGRDPKEDVKNLVFRRCIKSQFVPYVEHLLPNDVRLRCAINE